MSDRISSLDPGYQTGDLSVFPAAFDSSFNLYKATNFAETKIKQAVTYGGKHIIVEDASGFPPNGLLCIGPMRGFTEGMTQIYKGKDATGVTNLYYNTSAPYDSEIVAYNSRTNHVFKDLTRGFAGSRQNTWTVGTYVCNAVMAEPHNACKDAIINTETFVGTTVNPSDTSLYGRLVALENQALSPNPTFRAYPKSGTPPLTVRFQNTCPNVTAGFFWEFGDGTVSTAPNPTHQYLQEGTYTVKLTVQTVNQGAALASKKDYISVSVNNAIPFFYVSQVNPVVQPYSIATAMALQQRDPKGEYIPAIFEFIDQTLGDIKERYWMFGDGTRQDVINPYIHTVTHIYAAPNPTGYTASLLLVYANGSTRTVSSPSPIKVQ